MDASTSVFASIVLAGLYCLPQAPADQGAAMQNKGSQGPAKQNDDKQNDDKQGGEKQDSAKKDAAESGQGAKPDARKRDALRATTKSWPIFRGDRGLRGVAPGKLAADFELAWTFPTEGSVVSSPVVYGGVVYIGSSDYRLYAIDLETGKKRWDFETEDMIEAPPLYVDGRIYVGSNDTRVYCLDATSGKEIWRFETGDKIVGGANLLRLGDGIDRLVVGSYDNFLYGLNAKDGKELWKYETDNYVNGTPAISGEHVIFGGCDAILHMVSAKTGKSEKQVELGGDCHIAGSVATFGQEVYFGHYGNAFVRVDLDAGKQTWEYGNPRFAFFSSAAIGKDRVVFGGRDKHLHCVGRKDGKKIWTYKTRRKIDASPLICGDKVVFGGGDGRLRVLELETSKLLFEYELGRSITSSPAIVNGRIVIGSEDKSVYCFSPKAKKKAAGSAGEADKREAAAPPSAGSDSRRSVGDPRD